MANYHYTESGLDTVWLASGFRIIAREDGGESLIIEDIEGLHVAIGRGIVEKKKLTGPEIRFLRDRASYVAERPGAASGGDGADRRKVGEAAGCDPHAL